MKVHCPNNHLCKHNSSDIIGRLDIHGQVVHVRNLICDGIDCCNSIQKIGTDFWSCGRCDFDLCQDCAIKESKKVDTKPVRQILEPFEINSFLMQLEKETENVCEYNPNWEFMQPSTLAHLLSTTLGLDFGNDLTTLMASFIVERKITIDVLLCNERVMVPYHARKLVLNANHNCYEAIFGYNQHISKMLRNRKMKNAYVLPTNKMPNYLQDRIKNLILNTNVDFHTVKPYVRNFPSKGEAASYCYVGDVFKWDEIKLLIEKQDDVPLDRPEIHHCRHIS